jgi:2-dehydro-3-deoxyphosphogluconate aldolase/(4S)-4-hydroxy-2-oxoglutarate aldolase
MTEYDELTQKLQGINVVPVVALNSIEQALKLGTVLTQAGLNCIEVTFRTQQAPDCIKALKNEFPDMVIAAGTVLNIEQAQVAVNLGCDFIVSPAISVDVVRYCQTQKVPVVPGVCNPQQVEQGIALGLTMLKFFPAEVFGGVNFLKSIEPIYPVTFMPTGGIKPETWKNYLSLSNVICCGGSWIASNELMENEQWKDVEERAAATLV